MSFIIKKSIIFIYINLDILHPVLTVFWQITRSHSQCSCTCKPAHRRDSFHCVTAPNSLSDPALFFSSVTYLSFSQLSLCLSPSPHPSLLLSTPLYLLCLFVPCHTFTPLALIKRASRGEEESHKQAGGTGETSRHGEVSGSRERQREMKTFL